MNLPQDDFILELLPEFVETWINDIEQQFDKFFEAKDKDEMYRLAHTIKGSCYQFSLDEIGDMGVELLEKVKAEQWDLILPYKDSLLKKFKDAQQFLIDNNIL